MRRPEGRSGRATLQTRRRRRCLDARTMSERTIDVARRRVSSMPRHDDSVDQPLSVFLNPELIHAGERVRPFGLECMPAIEVARETVAAENVPIMLHDRRREFETDECQMILGDERLHVWNREPAFLDVKQQVAALAGAEE